MCACVCVRVHVCVCVCVNLSYLHLGKTQMNDFMNETLIGMTQGSSRGTRRPPVKGETIFGCLPSRRGKNGLNTLNAQVLQLTGVGGRAARGRAERLVLMSQRRVQIIHGDLKESGGKNAGLARRR